MTTHLDYRDIIYNQAYNVSPHQKLGFIQYNAALAITGAIRPTSRQKLYKELGYQSLVSKRWYHKICCSYKVFKTHLGSYSTLFLDVIPTAKSACITRNNDKVSHFKAKQLFQKFFLLFDCDWIEKNWIWTFVILKVSLVSKVKCSNLYALPKIVSFFAIIQKEYNY